MQHQETVQTMNLKPNYKTPDYRLYFYVLIDQLVFG